MLGAARTTGLYVAVGASDAVGVGARRPRREAWPRLLHRQVFRRDLRLVNLGVPGATVASALAGQVPQAERLRPDVVTAWLVVNDVVAAVPVATYETCLDELVGRLRRAATGPVLVGNCPYLDRLPAYLAGRAAGLLPGPEEANRIVDDCNRVIERVVGHHGARLVDLASAGLAARRAGLEPALFAGDGLHPSTAGHRALAGAFAAAVRTVSPVTRAARAGIAPTSWKGPDPVPSRSEARWFRSDGAGRFSRRGGFRSSHGVGRAPMAQ